MAANRWIEIVKNTPREKEVLKIGSISPTYLTHIPVIGADPARNIWRLIHLRGSSSGCVGKPLPKAICRVKLAKIVSFWKWLGPN